MFIPLFHISKELIHHHWCDISWLILSFKHVFIQSDFVPQNLLHLPILVFSFFYQIYLLHNVLNALHSVRNQIWNLVLICFWRSVRICKFYLFRFFFWRLNRQIWIIFLVSFIATDLIHGFFLWFRFGGHWDKHHFEVLASISRIELPGLQNSWRGAFIWVLFDGSTQTWAVFNCFRLGRTLLNWRIWDRPCCLFYEIKVLPWNFNF